MILKLISLGVDTAVDQLPEPDMVVDPRPIGWASFKKFEVKVVGRVMTVTGIDREEDRGTNWLDDIRFRIYSRNEFHYSFESTKYLYHGIVNEWAPEDATEIICKDGIEIIRHYAFHRCSSLSKITIPNTVTKIKEFAFYACRSLRCIQLPPNLQSIENGAFNGCSSLEAIYIPPTVTEIGEEAFGNCKSLRIINIPDSVQHLGINVVGGFNDIRAIEIAHERSDDQDQWLRNRYTPLHNLCWDPSVTAHDIQQNIQQHILTDEVLVQDLSNNRKDVKRSRKRCKPFHKLCCKPSEADVIHERKTKNEEKARTNDKPQFTPLHLLAANPSVTGDMITAYLHFAPDVAVMQDNIGKTPLHMLCLAPNSFNDRGGAIRAYLGFEEGRRAAFARDKEGKTPLDRLCEKGFDEMPFLKNKYFGGMMVWWYDCLGMDLFTVEANLIESEIHD